MKKLLLLFLTLILSTGLLFSLPFNVEAHKQSKFIEQYEQLDEEKKQQVDEILDHLHEEIKKLGVNLPHPNAHKKYSQLDEDTKEQVKTIIKELEEGKISANEADEKLKELGVELPEKGDCKAIDKLDDDTKKKLKQLVEEAEIEFEKIGIEFPGKKYKRLLD